MSDAGSTAETRGACTVCLRRSWLLAALGAPLDYRSRDRESLLELLALDDEALLAAVGGRRKTELKARWGEFDPGETVPALGVERICRHDRRFPQALDGAWAPHALSVVGSPARLSELTAAPVAAIVGSRRATDYGMEMAKCLARGLAASGVTIASGLTDGVAVAAHAGALEAKGGSTVMVMGGGLDRACPARRRSLFERAVGCGCAVAELPCGWPARRWAQAASERIVAGLAGLTIVVEADASAAELAGARIAASLGRIVAAVPGRVTSRASCGAHELLMAGAHLVRGPHDALELLCGVDVAAVAGAAATGIELPRTLRATLERVGAGADTPNKLTRDGRDSAEVLLALSELELMGLIARGDGGRYVVRDALFTPSSGAALAHVITPPSR
jgi:DNA processing protein